MWKSYSSVLFFVKMIASCGIPEELSTAYCRNTIEQIPIVDLPFRNPDSDRSSYYCWLRDQQCKDTLNHESAKLYKLSF